MKPTRNSATPKPSAAATHLQDQLDLRNPGQEKKLVRSVGMGHGNKNLCGHISNKCSSLKIRFLGILLTSKWQIMHPLHFPHQNGSCLKWTFSPFLEDWANIVSSKYNF